jgi:aryl-alcohol dehydrogenase-like predicted oxidoreductase
MTRLLGRSGLNVSPLGLGCATFGREIDEEASFRLMDYAVANGITLFDTAEVYGGGHAKAYRLTKLGIDDSREVSDELHSSEKIVGRWLRSRGARDQITLVSKAARGFTPPQVRQALEASLQRLQTDRLDLYLYHSYDPETPAEAAVEAMAQVVASGLTRAGGTSNYSLLHLEQALALARGLDPRVLSVIEVPHNLLRACHETVPVAERDHLGVLGYSPLAAGFLTGKYSPDREAIPRGTRFDIIPGHIDIYFTPANFQRVERLHALARREGVPPLLLAFAWALQDPRVTNLLVGARTQAHLDNALEAARFPIPDAWMDEIASWH